MKGIHAKGVMKVTVSVTHVIHWLPDGHVLTLYFTSDLGLNPLLTFGTVHAHRSSIMHDEHLGMIVINIKLTWFHHRSIHLGA